MFYFPEIDNLSKLHGVYKIEINNHIYIGSCANIRDGFRGRFNAHKRLMLKNKHHSKILQNCFNKYKEAIFSIIEICDKEFCISREQYWIDTLKPDMNVLKFAGSVLGRKCSYEHKQKLSESNKGKHSMTQEEKSRRSILNKGKKLEQSTKDKISKANKGRIKNIKEYENRFKPIIQYDLYGNIIREYLSIRGVENFGYCSKGISACCKGINKTLYNSVWRYKEDSFNKYSIIRKESKTKINAKKVNQYSSQMLFIKTWESVDLASKELKICKSSINRCLKGKFKHAGGFNWKYYDV